MARLGQSPWRSTPVIAGDAPGALPVVFGVDAKFLPHAAITLQSVIECNPGVAYHFHFISCACLTAAQAQMVQMLEGTGCLATFHQVDAGLFTQFPQTALFPQAAYYRLLAPFILRGSARLLYLDADIVCLQPLAPLWRALAEGQVVAAVSDAPKAVTARCASLGLAAGQYFNSGVLLVDVPRWHQAKVTQRAFEVLEARATELCFPDQDALNIVLEGQVEFVEGRYNCQFMLGHKRSDYARAIPAGTVLLHYAGANKPWQVWNRQAGVAPYHAVRARSPWRKQPLDMPATHEMARRVYRQHLRRQGWPRALTWLLSLWMNPQKVWP
ncbi:glycosyltransferase [Pseudomonas sp. NPDC007930]|uniref:glycosyltransferase family 8 protein n=1 Tax=Pseudomonas sp. NPDC007930 TaxID=3364417 RepID=UPI0036E2C9A7